MNLMNIIGGISDRHIEEFAFVSPKKRNAKSWRMVASAACLTAVIAAVIVTVPKNKETMPEISFSEFSSWAYCPSVYFNDTMYNYYGRTYHLDSELSGGVIDHTENLSYSDDTVSHYTECFYDDGYLELPEGYVEVGEITTKDEIDSNVNGFATGSIQGLNIGEKIYQNPDDTDDLYVYTVMFGNEEYSYYHFVIREAYFSLHINGKTYVWASGETFPTSLPDGYSEVGEVTTNDRNNKIADGFGRELNVGDKIYSSPEFPDTVYVYTNAFSSNLCYLRYIAYNK